MPELPEVEVLRRELAAHLPGRCIVRAAVEKPRMLVYPGDRRLSDVEGRTIESVGRRAKLLIFELSGEIVLVMHLKLAGQLILRRGDETLVAGGHPVPRFDAPMPHRSTHGRFELDDGSVLWLTDIRQFGRVAVLPASGLPDFMGGKSLGIEPFDAAFTPAYLAGQLGRHRKLAIKSTLLDQSGLVGLGNIYADEVLRAAELHPLALPGELTDGDVERLHAAIQTVLRFAIENGVADIPNGKVRVESTFPLVHGRSGRPCLTCGTAIVRIKVGARSTDFCPTCQPRRTTLAAAAGAH